MGIQERRQRQKDEVNGSILEAAWQIVLREGWQALSIRKIADAIEYSVPVIYSHFENKEAILLEFTKQGYRQLARQLQQAQATQVQPGQQLEAMAQAYWSFAFDHKEYYQLMFGLGMPACETVNQVSEMKLFSDTILLVIKAAIEQSSQPQVDTFFKFHTYWSILHGLVSIQLISKLSSPHLSGQLILQDAIGSFIKGLE